MSVAGDLLRAVPYHTWRSYCPPGSLPFVVIFLPRTGSNLLAAMLDSHPQILCHHEVFNVDSIHRSLSYKDTSLSFGTVEERNRNPYGFLERVFAFSEGQTAVGFKLSPGQNNAALLSLLLARPVRKILLERSNWLQAYTSASIAEQTQVRSVAKGEGDAAAPRKRVKARVDLGDLRRFIRKRRFFHALTRGILRATGQRFVSIDYDDIGTTAKMKQVLDLLEVGSHEPLEVRTIKQNPSRLADRIENYDEVRRALAGTDLARYLDPPAP